MPQNILLTIEPMTAESFAPFGEVWQAAKKPDDHRIMEKTGFSCDGQTTVSVIWQPCADPCFHELERHFRVTQSFIQLAGGRAVVCAAPPSATDDPTDVPAPESVRAFLIDPAIGYSFRRGTWHSLNRFVLDGDGATFVIINSDPNPTQMINYETSTLSIFTDLDNCQPQTAVHPTAFNTRFTVDVPT
jgi:ureidoglycolate lyase